MSRAVRISEKAARRILSTLERLAAIDSERNVTLDSDTRELRRQLEPRPKLSAGKPQPRRSGRPSLTNIRKAVERRAGLLCECGCGRWFRGVGGAAELDHFFGRGREESVETCWRLRSDCHQEKTLNKPDAATWLRKFISHASAHGYEAARELAHRRLEALQLSGRAG